MNREDWLKERQSGIGGSDIAALLGLSPYKTPLQLWLEKTGREEPQHDSDALERMHWGTVLEDVVARHYSHLHDVRVQRINDTLRHPQAPVALANIDRAVVEPGSRARWDDDARRVLGASRLLEVKTAHALARHGADWGSPGSDEVPQHYWLQCQWYLGITGLPFADLAVLFGGQKYAEYVIASDSGLFDDLIAEADGWWRRHILADTPPDPSTEDEARQLWKSHVAGKAKIVDVTVAEAVDRLAEIKGEIMRLEEEAQRQRDIILPAFGDAEEITYMGRRLATWRRNKDSVVTDWKALVHYHWPVPPAELIEQFTTTKPGARVLRLNTKEQ